MITLKVNQDNEFTFESKNNTQTLNGKELITDVIRTGDQAMHLIYNNQSYRIEKVRTDETGKEMIIKVNGIKHTVTIQDELDVLLRKMGLDKLATAKLNQIKAPMPGLVLRLMAKEGDMVKKGEGLLVLEAMKMENVIKSPADITIKKILVQEKTAVEKNQVLIELV